MNIEDQYINLMKEILKSGTAKSDRTGTGTLSIFGKQLRHKMSCGFPLLTTKKVPLKTVATELIWMLMGRTDLRWLLQHNCRIWTGDAYKKYANYASNLDEPDWDLHVDDPHENCTRIMSKSEFEEMILSNDIFSEQWGDLGFIYGKQWRYWNGTKTAVKIDIKASPVKWNYIGGIDQIANLISELKDNPDCRRLLVNAWNATELDQMTLPPCHYGFQVYTREIDVKDELNLIGKIVNYKGSEYRIKCIPPVGLPFIIIDTENGDLIIREEWLDSPIVMDENTPTRAISLMWNQRSADVPLGLPFDIASYAILLEILAKECNMVSDELICNLGDCHIYKNQIKGAKEQVIRKLYDLPSLQMKDTFHYLFDDVKRSFTEKIEYLTPNMFVINNYEYHPKIDYPLSN